jgi:TatA/E family protein of Tat protein translocase
MPGPLELIIVAVIAALVLGTKRLPTFARSLGKGVREVKDATGLDAARAELAELREAASGSPDTDETSEGREGRTEASVGPAS